MGFILKCEHGSTWIFKDNEYLQTIKTRKCNCKPPTENLLATEYFPKKDLPTDEEIEKLKEEEMKIHKIKQILFNIEKQLAEEN